MKMETDCRIVEESMDRLGFYGSVPIRFEVRRIFEVEGDNPGTAVLREKAVTPPWIKNYDAIKGEGPTRWAKRWDIRNWGILAAYIDEKLVGGCVLAHNTDGVNKLAGRDDLVAMWDIRVHPDHRGNGIGHRVFETAVQWTRDRNCRELKIETQNINVPACLFYQRQGCQLSEINRHAYPDLPDEVELIWSLQV